MRIIPSAYYVFYHKGLLSKLQLGNFREHYFGILSKCQKIIQILQSGVPLYVPYSSKEISARKTLEATCTNENHKIIKVVIVLFFPNFGSFLYFIRLIAIYFFNFQAVCSHKQTVQKRKYTRRTNV